MMGCGGARAWGRMIQRADNSPPPQAWRCGRFEKTSTACVLTPSLFGWRRKKSCLLRKRIAYLLFPLQEESNAVRVLELFTGLSKVHLFQMALFIPGDAAHQSQVSFDQVSAR